MKLRFSIHYSTSWGQSLHVVISYYDADGRCRSHNLPMQTQDGEVWTMETDVMESRRRPLSSVDYYYRVEDGEGKVIRTEWNLVPRRYSVDTAKEYLFPDRWRDVPLQLHLYSKACLTTTGRQREDGVEALKLPLFRRTVVFRVSAPQLGRGESVGICGSHPALGDWNPAKFQRLTPIGNYEWVIAVNAYGLYLPLEYKFVVIDDAANQLKQWEEGENRTTGNGGLADGQVLVLYGETLRVKEELWRCAGVVVAVSSLRSEHSFGIGDFGDLKRLLSWASATGLRMVQLLPLNDTRPYAAGSGFNPYLGVSQFALHPLYLDLEALGEPKDKTKKTAFRRQRRELNALPTVDFEAVERVKKAYADHLFMANGSKVLASEGFKRFFEANRDWLVPYAEYVSCEGYPVEEVWFVQYFLHLQLTEVVSEARLKGISIVGHLPSGICHDSVEAVQHPEFFHANAWMGRFPGAGGDDMTPADYQVMDWNCNGNSYAVDLLKQWWNRRLEYMEQFFDGVCLEHVARYFRVWEVPTDQLTAVMGHFAPALPLSIEEIEQYGLAFRRELFTRPYISDKILDKTFGIHCRYVKDEFLDSIGGGLYKLKDEYSTQTRVREHFAGLTDENSLWIRDGLYSLITNVLFLEDGTLQDMFHPRFGVFSSPVYEVLNSDEKGAFMRLYNSYYYERHTDYWGYTGRKKLGMIANATRMLIIGDDSSDFSEQTTSVLDDFRILSVEVQTHPKAHGSEFSHLEANPYRSVAMASTPAMPPFRQWWQEHPGHAQRYYITLLQQEGRAPGNLPAHLAEKVIARHLYCPSMLCLLALQDWLSMNADIRPAEATTEQARAHSGEYQLWHVRMPITIEELLKANQFNNKIQTMVQRSRR